VPSSESAALRDTALFLLASALLSSFSVATSSDSISADEPLRGKHILVVEDRASLRDLLAEILSFEGHNVDTVANGATALERLRRRSYDLIVSDLQMPVLDGPSLYRELRQSSPHLLKRIVFITGNAEDPALYRFLNDTGAPCVSKPFTVETILRVAEQVLRAAVQQDEGDAAQGASDSF
jgi:CheY-like chemotaxis protein